MRRLLAVVSLVACGALDPSTPPTSITYTFAIHDFFLGDMARDHTYASYDAWKAFGHDIDGKITDDSSTDVCTLYPGGSQVDGNGGIDNSFGAKFVQTIDTRFGPPSVTMTRAVQAGAWTLEIEVAGLSDDPAQSSYGLLARTFEGAKLDAAPAFDDSTSWPVLSSSLVDGATIEGGATGTFPNARIDHGTFTSGAATGPVHFSLVFQGAPLGLVLHDPRITFRRSTRTDVVDGTISGVLDLDEFIAMMHAAASHISTSLCGSAFDGLAAQYRAAADILVDGSNASGVTCDGISVGFGFNATLIANPTQVVQAAPLADACP